MDNIHLTWWGLQNEDDKMWLMMKYGFNNPFKPERLTEEEIFKIYNIEINL